MRCYALAASIDGNPFSWTFGNTPFNLNSFHAPLKKNWHHELMKLAEGMKSGEECSLKLDNYPFVIHIKKREQSACIALTDESLKKEELDNLFSYIQDFNISMSFILKNFETYLKKDKLLQIEEELRKTMQQMIKNVDLLLQSQENIESLVQRTEELANSSLSFKIKKQHKSSPLYIFRAF